MNQMTEYQEKFIQLDNYYRTELSVFVERF